MAKTAAERQSDRRKRLRYESDGEKARYQLSVLIARDNYHRLGRLARHHGITKADLMDKLIKEEYERMTASMSADDFREFNRD